MTDSLRSRIESRVSHLRPQAGPWIDGAVAPIDPAAESSSRMYAAYRTSALRRADASLPVAGEAIPPAIEPDLCELWRRIHTSR